MYATEKRVSACTMHRKSAASQSTLSCVCVFEGRLMRDCFTVIIQNRLRAARGIHVSVFTDWVCAGPRWLRLLMHGGEKWKNIHLICISLPCVQSGKEFLFMSSLPHFTAVFWLKKTQLVWWNCVESNAIILEKLDIYKLLFLFSLIEIQCTCTQSHLTKFF